MALHVDTIAHFFLIASVIRRNSEVQLMPFLLLLYLRFTQSCIWPALKS